jgi:hypothetical protein
VVAQDYEKVILDASYTILPTPGDPTNIILSTEDTSAWPVSAKLKINKG